jgi:hypothetical protein
LSLKDGDWPRFEFNRADQGILLALLNVHRRESVEEELPENHMKTFFAIFLLLGFVPSVSGASAMSSQRSFCFGLEGSVS